MTEEVEEAGGGFERSYQILMERATDLSVAVSSLLRGIYDHNRSRREVVQDAKRALRAWKRHIGEEEDAEGAEMVEPPYGYAMAHSGTKAHIIKRHVFPDGRFGGVSYEDFSALCGFKPVYMWDRFGSPVPYPDARSACDRCVGRYSEVPGDGNGSVARGTGDKDDDPPSGVV